VRATEFEFRYRFYVIGVIFWLSFSLYNLQHVNAGKAICKLLHHGQCTAGQLRWIYLAGALVIFAGGGIRTWAAAYLHSEVVHDANLHSDRLVAEGPYRHLRNPLYVGTILLAAGLSLMASPWGAVVLIGLIVLFSLRLIGREEWQLEQSQSQSYRAYRAAVPRLWPSLGARVPAAGTRPRWGQAWLGELPVYCFGLTLGVFALTFSLPAFFAGIVASLALYFVLQWGFKIVARRQPVA